MVGNMSSLLLYPGDPTCLPACLTLPAAGLYMVGNMSTLLHPNNQHRLRAPSLWSHVQQWLSQGGWIGSALPVSQAGCIGPALLVSRAGWRGGISPPPLARWCVHGMARRRCCVLPPPPSDQVVCARHGKETLLRTAADFESLVGDGGCQEMCGDMLSCGHICPRYAGVAQGQRA